MNSVELGPRSAVKHFPPAFATLHATVTTIPITSYDVQEISYAARTNKHQDKATCSSLQVCALT